MNFGFLRKKEFIWFVILVALFFVLRLPGVHIPYHQDEYKWVFYSHSEIVEPGTVPHPPLTEFIYAKTLGPFLGDNNFRLIPLIFSFINLFLIFYLVKIISGTRAAFWTAFIFSVSFFSVLASLMVDVDGAVMPFFFLILSISYFELKKRNFQNYIWPIPLVVGAVGGFFIKVSAVLPICAFALDFAIEKGVFKDKRKIIKYVGWTILGASGLVIMLILAKFIFPFFNLEYSFNYWKHFANSSGFFDRGWFQTFIQFAKSVLYTSPLLVLPVFFADKEIWQKLRPFFLFIFIGLVFYLFAFDFSIGALDRYFQFLIIPLCIITGVVFTKYLNFESGIKSLIKRKEIIIPIIISIFIFLVQYLSHYAPPLYPKTEWLSRVLSLKWNFLYPFNGGSGPLPFYVSFAFMTLTWIFSSICVALFFTKNNFKKYALIGILILGLLYNTVFIEEYLFGKINGNASGLIKDSTKFIKNNPEIKYVTVYNDNGGFNVMQTDKYRKRLYIDPKFNLEDKIKTLNMYKEHYLVIDIPHIDADTIYAKYFLSCKKIYDQKSKQISAIIYNCQNAPDIKI